MKRRGFERKVIEGAERKLALHAVWCLGPPHPVWLSREANAPACPVAFGTSKDPDEVLRQARKWNWHKVDLLSVVWCRSEKDADAVREELEDIASEAHAIIRGRWYDIDRDTIEQAIRVAADGAGVEIFDEATRTEKLRQEVRRQIEKMRNR